MRRMSSTMNAAFGTQHTPAGLRSHEDTNSSHPILVQTKIFQEIESGSGRGSESGSNEAQSMSLPHFLQSRCPALFEEFQPAWWLPNGHAQTIKCVVGDFSQIDQVVYERKYLRLRDGGSIGLDFTPPGEAGCSFKEDTPVVVVAHGLTGGSHESYVRNILAPACTPVEEGGLGYRGVVFTARGCGGTYITSPQFYSAYHTDDLRQALMYLSTLYPKAPLLGVGFSGGANVLIRYLAQAGHQSLLKSGCALGAIWDAKANNIVLERGWITRTVYGKRLGSNLVRAHARHLETLKQWPDHPVTIAVQKAATLKYNPTITEFDEIVTRIGGGSIAPHGPFPFRGVHRYYEAASCHNILETVAVPLLAVNAGDDPMIRIIPADVGENPLVGLMVTPSGGHLGWFESDGVSLLGVKRWTTKPVLEWLKATAEELVGVDGDLPLQTYVDGEGWLTMKGHEHLGVKLAEEVERIEGTEGQEGILPGL